MATRTTVKSGACLECGKPNPNAGHNVYCDPCREKRRAQWKAEHTRQGPTDTRKRWLIGDECQVKIGKVTYQAKIIDMSDVSRRESDHDLMKLELSKSVKGWDDKPITHTWVHPEPVQSYKLRKPLLKDEVSA